MEQDGYTSVASTGSFVSSEVVHSGFYEDPRGGHHPPRSARRSAPGPSGRSSSRGAAPAPVYSAPVAATYSGGRHRRPQSATAGSRTRRPHHVDHHGYAGASGG